MKISIHWLKELVDLQVPIEEAARLLPLRTISIKEVTSDFIELDMKGYNRSDLLSMRGVACEVAAITNSSVNFAEPDHSNYTWVGQNLPKVEAKVGNENLIPVYCLAKIENLKIEHSPDTWVKKLNDSGFRSVNNVADVTNLVMLEYGQPLHAFDAQKIKGAITARTALQGETLQTLDGKNRKLFSSDLVIADSRKAIAIAGVMGGKESEVGESTTSILLEAAIFDPVSIRKTATRLGLQSEASKRFYHGLTQKRLFQALDAAIKMYQDMGGKLTGLIILGNLKDQVKKIPLTLKKAQQLIGVNLDQEQVKKYLRKLNFELSVQEDGQSWVVTPPYYRLDIEIEEDLIEEVTRMYGYEKIPVREINDKEAQKTNESIFRLTSEVKRVLVGLGLTEVQTYSFYSTTVLNNLGLNKEELVRVANPISSETEYMRDQIWPNLVEAIAKNIRYGHRDAAVFELGKAYSTSSLPKEEYHLAVAISNDTDAPYKELDRILRQAGLLKNEETRESEPQRLFHPVRFWKVTKKGDEVGFIGEIHPRIMDRFGVDNRVAVAQVRIGYLENT